MKWINVFCLICIFLCAGFFHNSIVAAEKDDFEYAENLFQDGNFFEAAIAFERIFFLSNDSQVRIKANLRRAEALKQQGKFREARMDLQRSVHMRSFPDDHFMVLYQMAFCDYMLGNYTRVISGLRQLEHFYPGKSNAEKVWLLYALAHIMNSEYQQAQAFTDSLIAYQLVDENIAEELKRESQRIFSAENLPVVKSENRAANLSTFFPGVGHMYAGYTGKGILNASSQVIALGLAGIMAYHQLYISGFVIGLGMFQSFYFGGIRQATFLASQRNLKETADWKEQASSFVIEVYEL